MDPGPSPQASAAPEPGGASAPRLVLSDAERVELARLSPAGWALVASEGRWQLAPHLALLNRVVLEVLADPDGGRLMVVMPPTHGKSEVLSRYLPSWYLGLWPERRVTLASYGIDLARQFGRFARRDLDAFGPAVFGLSVSEESAAAEAWEIAGYEGGLRAVGIGGGLTGHHPHLLIIDDPIKNHDEALSQSYRDSVWEWWASQASNRLMRGGAVIVVQTRWHEDDLCGRLLKIEKARWRELRLPALAEADGDPLGRKEGEALWPAQFPREALLRQKVSSGTYWFEAQYQGRPSPREGGLVKRSWWRFYEQAPECPLLFQSWDMTFKDTMDGSYVVGQVWGVRGADRYLLDQVRARMSFTETLAALLTLSAKWPRCNAKIIEDKANGPAVISTLQHRVPGLIAWAVKGSKEARLAAHTPEIEAGNVYLPAPALAPWVHDFIEELAAFPKGPDDQVDATSQALEYVSRATMQFVVSL